MLTIQLTVLEKYEDSTVPTKPYCIFSWKNKRQEVALISKPPCDCIFTPFSALC